MKKVLITGCGGMVGRSADSVFRKKNYEVMSTSRTLTDEIKVQLDVRDLSQLKKISRSFWPDYIVHLAALTNLELCTKDVELAHQTNYQGLSNVASVSKSLGIPFAYISTAGVFDGNQDNYTEESIPNPINEYGRTKYFGDLSVFHSTDNYLALRCGWMFGGGKRDKKFTAMIAKQIRTGKKDFVAVNDTRGSLTYTEDLAVTLERLLSSGHRGLYNVVSGGSVTRLDITKFLLDHYKVRDYNLESVPSSYFNKDFSVKRASHEVLSTYKLDKTGLSAMRPWEVSMKEYLDRFSGEIGDYFMGK